MLLERKIVKKFFNIFEKLSEKTFDISTQYKFILLKKEIEKDGEIIDEQLDIVLNRYAEKNEQGKIIYTDDGGVKVKEELAEECLKKIEEIQTQKIQLPDVYFSFDELDDLGLTLEELSVLEPFIKI